MLIQGVLLVAVGVAGWWLGADWSGPLRLASAVVGILLTTAGIALVLGGVLALDRAVTPLPRPRDDAVLVETGAYAFLRHPIYGGLILIAFGWAVVRASIVAVALAALLAVFLWVKSIREEAWLEQRFAAYAAYRARTPRFIPWPIRSRR